MSEVVVDLRGARILVVDDVPANIDVLCQALEAADYGVMVASSGEVALDLAARFTPELILLDVVMPGLDGFQTCRRLKQEVQTRPIPVIFLTARDDPGAIAEGFRVGGVDYILKPFHKEEVLARIQTHLEKARLMRQLQEQNRALEEEVAQRRRLASERDHLADRISHLSQREAEHWGLHGFVGQSRTLHRILGDVELLQSAQTTSVLILGESGTGKELIARAIHNGSARSQGPFVPVNCASIPHELADSLLFGHVKGAFTGAERDQAGYFELAHEGTLFLDEVGSMPSSLQPKLLRVLEDRAILPLGARQPRQVEVRVLAATNTDLQQQIQAGGFRQDLYFRLARFTVQVPPLRERREDLALLTRHFLQILSAEMGVETPALAPEALSLLEGYEFPGNVRELKNVVERALIESRGAPQLLPEHLQRSLLLPLSAVAPALPSVPAYTELPLNLEQAELALIQRALEQTHGNVSEAARLLGVDRTKIYRRLPQLGKPAPPADPA